MTTPLAIPLAEAAVLLSYKDNRSVLQLAARGDIIIRGNGKMQRVVMSSIVAYLEGGPWHARNRSRLDASQAQEPYDTGRAASGRTKRRSRSAQANTDSIALPRERKRPRR